MYNLTEDPGETNDLSSKYPQRVEDMVGVWKQYEEDNEILDVALDLADKVK